MRKPPWIRVRAPLDPRIDALRGLFKGKRLHTVCEEASCPNLGECFQSGVATFLILGDVCTRNCPYCHLAHGRPAPPDADEPRHLAEAAEAMGLSYVVITSVDRDDLPDGGAGQFAACIRELRKDPRIHIEILVPDFRRREELALSTLADALPDVLNHNIETVPRLYRTVRPGADYRGSLALLARFKALFPEIPTKSGLMLGLGEGIDEIEAVLHDLREHGCDMLTLGQYLQPSRSHLPVVRYVPPEEFARLKVLAESLGFQGVASAPLVRSSYHAEAQHGRFAAGRPPLPADGR